MTDFVRDRKLCGALLHTIDTADISRNTHISVVNAIHRYPDTYPTWSEFHNFHLTPGRISEAWCKRAHTTHHQLSINCVVSSNFIWNIFFSQLGLFFSSASFFSFYAILGICCVWSSKLNYGLMAMVTQNDMRWISIMKFFFLIDSQSVEGESDADRCEKATIFIFAQVERRLTELRSLFYVKITIPNSSRSSILYVIFNKNSTTEWLLSSETLLLMNFSIGTYI